MTFGDLESMVDPMHVTPLAEQPPLTEKSDSSGTVAAVRWIVPAVWVIGISSAAIRAWVARHWMNNDGICYLDMADGLVQGDPGSLVNGYWSPLYPVLLAAIRVFQPSRFAEAPLVHLLNFGIFVGALAALHFLLAGLIRVRHAAGSDDNSAAPALSDQCLWAVGYAFGLYSLLHFVGLAFVTPDMCVAVAVFLAAGMIARLRAGDGPYRWFALLGMVLGLGYLAKAFMFLMSGVFLTVAVLAARTGWRRKLVGAMLAVLAFAATAGPYAYALGSFKGRPTYGDVGKLAYAWYVSGVPRQAFWFGGPPVGGQPRHAPHRILESPVIDEFAAPVPGTWPPAHDPSYWYEGLQIQLSPGAQVRATVGLLWHYVGFFLVDQGLIVPLLMALLLLDPDRRRQFGALGEWLWLGLPGLAAFGLYVLVYYEPRHLGPFNALLGLWILSAASRPASPEWAAIHRRLGVAALTALVFMLTLSTHRAVRYAAPNEQLVPSMTARELADFGVRPGDSVCMVGEWPDCYWARLAGVRIVARIEATEQLSSWVDHPQRWPAVRTALRSVGVRWLVCPRVHMPKVVPSGWRSTSSGELMFCPLELPPPTDSTPS